MRKTGEAQTLFASAAEKLESLFAGRVALRSIPEKAEGCDHDRPSADDTRRVAYKFRVARARRQLLAFLGGQSRHVVGHLQRVSRSWRLRRTETNTVKKYMQTLQPRRRTRCSTARHSGGFP